MGGRRYDQGPRKHVGIAMQPKLFPIEKREYILSKGFEELLSFFQEIAPAKRSRLSQNVLPRPAGGSFRLNTPILFKRQLEILWSDLRKLEHMQNATSDAWKIIKCIWVEWIFSQSELQSFLKDYNNEEDFEGDNSKPPNTNLDVACFDYLAKASLNNKIGRETIEKFYEFGYFQKDPRIEYNILVAKYDEDIKKSLSFYNIFDKISNLDKEVKSINLKIDYLHNLFNEIKAKNDNTDKLETYTNFKNSMEVELKDIKNNLENIGKTRNNSIGIQEFAFLEDNVKKLQEVFKSHDRELRDLFENMKVIPKIFEEKLENIEEKFDKAYQGFTDLQALLHTQETSDTIKFVDLTTSIPTPNETEKPSQILSQSVSPINNPDEFIQYRLMPALAEWLPDVSMSWAEVFHHALRACKWVLVPNPAWALAYGKAMGETAKVQLVQVEATWLCFTDAWKGAVEQYWLAAYEEPECLHILLLEDVNRSLPECWAKPWLDLLAGFRDVLPTENNIVWPDNIRILVCPASDKAALPLSIDIIKYWAAVPLHLIGEAISPPPPPLRKGYVSWMQWQVWGEPENNHAALRLEGLKDFGPLALSVSRDLYHIISSLNSDDPDRNARIANNIRINWPLEYVQS